MLLPSEIEAKSLIPAIRAILAKKLINEYKMRSPGVVTTTAEGRTRTLYMQNVSSIEEVTRPNLKKTLEELELCDGQQLVVADVTTVNSLTFILKYK